MATTTLDDGGEAEPTDVDVPQLTKDDLFHLLQNQRRRRILKYLQDADGPVDMRDVAEQVAAWENDVPVRQLSSDERQRVYIALYQSHLPKLDEEGVLDYDQDRGRVQRTAVANQLDPYLALGDDESTGADDEDGGSMTRYLGAATAASVVSTAASALGIVATSGLALATLLTGLFTALTVNSFLRDRARAATQ